MEEGEHRGRVARRPRGGRVREDGHRDRTRLVERARRDTTELLEVGADAERLAEVDREGPDVRPRVGDDVEDPLGTVRVDDRQAVDRTDAPLPADRGPDRRGLVD